MLAGTNLGAAVDEEREQLLGDYNGGVCQRMIAVTTTFGLSEMGYTPSIPQVMAIKYHKILRELDDKLINHEILGLTLICAGQSLDPGGHGNHASHVTIFV